MTDTARFYVGDAEDLDGLTRDEVINVSYETYDQAEDEVLEYFNDNYPEVSVGSFSWYAGDVLKKMDPIAFNCTVSDMVCEIDLGGYEE